MLRKNPSLTRSPSLVKQSKLSDSLPFRRHLQAYVICISSFSFCVLESGQPHNPPSPQKSIINLSWKCHESQGRLRLLLCSDWHRSNCSKRFGLFGPLASSPLHQASLPMYSDAELGQKPVERGVFCMVRAERVLWDG